MQKLTTAYGQKLMIGKKPDDNCGFITAVMVEIMGDSDWQWYEVLLTHTPKQAIELWLQDHNFENEIARNDLEFGGIIVDDLVRAYYFNIY
jgi:hypothetical protein